MERARSRSTWCPTCGADRIRTPDLACKAAFTDVPRPGSDASRSSAGAPHPVTTGWGRCGWVPPVTRRWLCRLPVPLGNGQRGARCRRWSLRGRGETRRDQAAAGRRGNACVHLRIIRFRPSHPFRVPVRCCPRSPPERSGVTPGQFEESLPGGAVLSLPDGVRVRCQSHAAASITLAGSPQSRYSSYVALTVAAAVGSRCRSLIIWRAACPGPPAPTLHRPGWCRSPR